MPHRSRNILALLLAAALSHAPAVAGERLSGAATAVDGRHLRLNGKLIALAGIAAPALDAKCLWRGKTVRACGRMARAAMRDLTVAAKVTCFPDRDRGGWRCQADGYDLAEGLIHAGWAIPAPGAPARWLDEKRRAKARRLMLWRARTLAGEDFLPALARKIRREKTPLDKN